MIYTAALRAALVGSVNFASDTFYALLLGPAYTPSAAHDFRSDITAEISGGGYTAGGRPVPVTVLAADPDNARVDVQIGPVDWTALTANDVRHMVVYKRRGGSATLDEVIFCRDFGSDESLVSGTLTVEAVTLRIQAAA
jgi:hypothetical protein